MARLIVKRVFNPNEPILARRAFSAAGRTYQPGDVFDWKRLSVSVRRVRLMYDAGTLVHSDEPVVQETVQESVQETPPAPPADNSDLDVDSLVVLQAIAQREGAVLKSTKIAQRQSIVSNRQG
jgi:hypothetical protein